MSRNELAVSDSAHISLGDVDPVFIHEPVVNITRSLTALDMPRGLVIINLEAL